MIYLFDFDGTLVDSMPYWTGVHINALKKYNIPIPDNFVNTITPLGNVNSSKYTISLGIPQTYEEYRKNLNDSLQEAYANTIQAKATVEKTLRSLKAEGHSINVLTASPHKYVDVCLKRVGIYDMFEEIWSIDDFGHTKAENVIYEMAAERLGVSVGDCVLVDDNFTAISTAKAAGMQTIAIYDATASDYEAKLRETAGRYIKDFGELLK